MRMQVDDDVVLYLIFRPDRSMETDTCEASEAFGAQYVIPLYQPDRIDEGRRNFFTFIAPNTTRLKDAYRLHGPRSAKFKGAWEQLEDRVRKWESTVEETFR